MTLLGYVSDSPQAAAIYLKAERGVLVEPELGEVSDPLSPILGVFSGKRAVHDSLRASGAIQPVYSLADAEMLVRNYTEGCAAVPVEGGNDIGGHIHIAVGTRGGLRWLVPPRSLGTET